MKPRFAAAASLVVLVVLSASVILLTKSPAEAATFGARLSYNPPIAGELVHVTGKVLPVKRAVVLQRARSGKWVAVTSARTKAGGSYSFNVRASKTVQQYRVYAPKLKVKHKKIAARTSKPVRVLGVTPSLTMSILPAPAGRSTAGVKTVSNAAGQTPGTATFRPARPGALVTVRRWDLATSRWVTAATARQNAAGNAYFQLWAGSSDSPQTFQAVSSSGGATAVSANVKPSYFANTFNEEFTSGKTNWVSREGVPSGNRMCSIPTDDMFSVASGLATLRVQKVSGATSTCPRGFWHYAAVGTSGGAADYKPSSGIFAARVKFQSAAGAHGSFWMQQTATTGREIDVVEYFGDKRPDGGIGSGVYSNNSANQHIGGLQPGAKSILGSGQTPSNGFHVYSVQWNSSGYVFRIDGIPVFSTNKLLTSEPEELMLSLAASDWELPKMGTQTSAAMQVDWVRGWETP
jgi:hypothetical protein